MYTFFRLIIYTGQVGGSSSWNTIGKLVEKFEVGGEGKVISVVAWREGSRVEGRKGLWAAGGAEGVVRVFGDREAG